MDEKPDQILEHIETQRNELGANLNELETRVRRTTDWRTHFDNNPMLMVGVAFGGGLLLGSMTGGRSSSRSYTKSSSLKMNAYPSSSSSSPSSPAVSAQRHKASETLDHIKAALIGFATAKAKEFLNDALPGFENHLREAQGHRGDQHQQHEGSMNASGSGLGDQSSGFSSQGSGQGQGANYGQSYNTGYDAHPGSPTTSQDRETINSGSFNR